MNIVLLMLIHPNGKTDQINSHTSDSLGDAYSVFLDWAVGINGKPLSPNQEAQATLTCRFGPVPAVLDKGHFIAILSWNCDTLIAPKARPVLPEDRKLPKPQVTTHKKSCGE